MVDEFHPSTPVVTDKSKRADEDPDEVLLGDDEISDEDEEDEDEA